MGFFASTIRPKMEEIHRDKCRERHQVTRYRWPLCISDSRLLSPKPPERHLQSKYLNLWGAKLGDIAYSLLFHTCHEKKKKRKKKSVFIYLLHTTEMTYIVVVNDSSPIIFESPKSANFTFISLLATRMFSGFMSRWTIPRSCYCT